MQHQSSSRSITEEVAACDDDKFSGMARDRSPSQQQSPSEDVSFCKDGVSVAREVSLEQETITTEELTAEVSSCEGEGFDGVARDVPPEQQDHVVVEVIDSQDPEFDIITRDLRAKQQDSGSPIGNRYSGPASLLNVDEQTKVRLAKQVSQATAPGVYVESDNRPKPSHEQLERMGHLRLMHKDRQSRHGNPEDPLPDPTDEPVNAVLLDDFQERMNDFRIKEDQVTMVEDEDLSERRKMKWSLVAIVVSIALVGVGVVIGIILGRGGEQTNDAEVQTHDGDDMTGTYPYDDSAAKAFNECFMRNDTIPSDGFVQLRNTVSSALWWGSGQIDTAGSIQRAALCWLADYDTLESGIVEAPTYEVVQRFALATIYYHFVGVASETQSSELSASNWVDHVHVCLWDFVVCDTQNNRVTELFLVGLNLNKPMPDEIALLSDLVSLKVTRSHLTGQIPPSLSALTDLEVLDLRGNHLTGSLPSGLVGSLELREIQFAFNNLEGEIPPRLFQLPKLHSLFLHDNHLTGTLPSALQNATGLTGFTVGRNHLVGTIPDISRLTKLKFLALDNNGIEDFMPDISRLTNLGKKTNDVCCV